MKFTGPIKVFLVVFCCVWIGTCAPVPTIIKKIRHPDITEVRSDEITLGIRTSFGYYIADLQENLPNVDPYQTYDGKQRIPGHLFKKASKQDFESIRKEVTYSLDFESGLLYDASHLDPSTQDKRIWAEESNARFKEERGHDLYRIVRFPHDDAKSQFVRLDLSNPYQRNGGFTYLYYHSGLPDRLHTITFSFDDLRYSALSIRFLIDPMKGVH
jgi:hypothetical protein